MTKDVPVVHEDDPVPHLINVVVSTRLNRAVIVDGARRPIGVVSDAELIERVTPEARPGLVAAVMRRLPLLHGSAEAQDALHHARGKSARDFMREDFIRVAGNSTIEDTLRELISQRRKIAVVVDADGRLLGIADRRDLLSALV
jgi:CBS domain-containing protein